MYSKTCVYGKIGFQDQLLLNAGQKYCRMLQTEHSAILSTFIKLPLFCHFVLLQHLFTIASAMVIYVSKLPWACVRFEPVLLASCGNGPGVNSPAAVYFTVLSQTPFSNSPSIKLLPKFHHCVSDVDIHWIPDCF